MNKKHLTLDDRITIKAMPDSRAPFKEIARTLQVHCTTISKEVRARLIFKKSGCFGHAFNDCKHRFNCSLSKLCNLPSCRYKKCKNCTLCYKFCSSYEKESCDRLLKPPYVCNGCEKKKQFSLEKRLYSASVSHAEYRTILKESRSGISISEEEALSLDTFLSPLLYKGHSPHHICITNKDEIMLSERTLYHYINAGIFEARNIDLPRKVKYKPRKSQKSSFKVDKKCRIGRTYHDYMEYMKQHPDTQGNKRSKVFYCDPSSPYQKGAIENNHEFIRRILPKGESLDMVTVEQAILMMNHINSYKRANLGNKSPYEVFRLFYGQKVLNLLGASLIPSNEIILSPKLLK